MRHVVHTRLIADYGGLAKVMPVYAGFFLFIAFASIGLPALSGFIGEFTVLIGSYLTWPVLAIIAASGVILAAIYMLWAYERMFTGPVTNPRNEGLHDLGFREVDRGHGAHFEATVIHGLQAGTQECRAISTVGSESYVCLRRNRRHAGAPESGW